MAPSLKDKGGRLLAFANGGPKPIRSQSQPENAPQNIEQPQSIAPVPVRRAFGDPREVPGLAGRHTAPPRENHPLSIPPPRSPPLSVASSNGRMRGSSSDRRPDLFSGSQLGDNFMESGITTPQNEPAEPVKLGPELTRDLKKINPPRPLPDNRLQRLTQITGGFNFGGGSNMEMKLPQRHTINPISDGFQDTVITARGKPNGRQEERVRPESPARPDARLPMREIRIRKSHTGRSEAYDIGDRVRSPSPTVRGVQWPTHHRQEDPRRAVDNDVEYLSQEDEHATPRPKKPKPAPRVLLESSMPAVATSTSRDKKRRRPSPEYDDVALRSMSFAALQQQPFDFDPSKEEQKGIGVNADNLAAKLDQFRHLGDREQRDLFSNMSIEDWESSGDWFVSEFTGFMQRLTEARRHKRRIIREFEKEAADREEAVRLRTEAIDRKLCKMKQDGQRVVEDRGA
ncbi:extracellular mutant protein 11-domain-containing protein [Fusarium solani]|uniref:Extracellular mutant protein 11-domain-containing protein n=1 Tax=Fusarium solani TaxID=169388 RepID=A0A9P9L848_FUSSL|nr:extracellular mutant protein 11-domain-containing protein [Fusarium solani]KAH7275658.1 extracellular mutant protein 11-domain-containing protein [Fusarium solani]